MRFTVLSTPTVSSDNAHFGEYVLQHTDARVIVRVKKEQSHFCLLTQSDSYHSTRILYCANCSILSNTLRIERQRTPMCLLKDKWQ